MSWPIYDLNPFRFNKNPLTSYRILVKPNRIKNCNPYLAGGQISTQLYIPNFVVRLCLPLLENTILFDQLSTAYSYGGRWQKQQIEMWVDSNDLNTLSRHPNRRHTHYRSLSAASKLSHKVSGCPSDQWSLPLQGPVSRMSNLFILLSKSPFPTKLFLVWLSCNRNTDTKQEIWSINCRLLTMEYPNPW